MFSWSIFWVACLFIGIVGANSKSQAANTIFQLSLLIASTVLIHFGLKVDLLPLFILFVFAFVALVLIKLRYSVLWILIPVLLIWVTAKCIGFVLVPSLSLLGFIGISYFIVKFATFLRDYQSGLIKNPKILTLMNYLFFAPTFLAGPMHYYREFDKSIREPRLPSPIQIIPLAFLILWGATKTLVISPLLAPHGFPIPLGNQVSITELVLRACVFTFQLYFEFSGYSDLAIGSAKLIGIETPENFNNPLWSKNIVEFWQKWHITLMRAITSYVYVPLARKISLTRIFNPKASMAFVTVCAFVVSGFWHGATTNFILWGIYNALIIIIYELIRPYIIEVSKMPRFSGKFFQLLWDLISIVVTFFFISLGWILFNLNSTEMLLKFNGL